MFKTFFFVVCFLISTLIFSQNVKVKWSSLTNEELQFKKVVPFADELIKLSLRKEGHGKKAQWIPVLTKLNQNLGEVASVTLSEVADRKYETLIKMKENLFALISEDGDQRNQVKYSAQLINTETLKPEGALIPVAN